VLKEINKIYPSLLKTEPVERERRDYSKKSPKWMVLRCGYNQNDMIAKETQQY
jgi:hypothetical protein